MSRRPPQSPPLINTVHATEKMDPNKRAALPLSAAAPARVFKPTPQQAAFISALVSTDRNITLEARAGCGKTSAILMRVDA